MAFQMVDQRVGWPAINDVSTTQKIPTGSIAYISDQAGTVPLGGEAVYLKAGGANIVVGSVCELDPNVGAILAPATGGEGPVVISLNIVPSGSFAWFAVEGTIPVKSPNATVIGAAVFMLAATAGSVDDAAVAGEQILNAEFASSTGVPSTGLALVTIDRPFHQGQIT